MALLVLIRHGQSTYNLQNLFTGDLDVTLSPLGIQEAHKAGRNLKSFHFDVAYTSVLERAAKTLSIILEEIGQTDIPIVQNAALNERRYGDLQGLNKAETTQKYGEAQVEIWRKSFDVRPPGGESLKDTYNRTVPYYQTEIEPKLKDGKNILIIAHGNSLRALKMYLENLSETGIDQINVQKGRPRAYVLNNRAKLVSATYLG